MQELSYRVEDYDGRCRLVGTTRAGVAGEALDQLRVHSEGCGQPNKLQADSSGAVRPHDKPMVALCWSARVLQPQRAIYSQTCLKHPPAANDQAEQAAYTRPTLGRASLASTLAEGGPYAQQGSGGAVR